ncbi:MAG: orotate phosphoribosyltransferase [Bacteroidetes bacterium]|nr:orotate phosphoribosyltransferase [Bacteroidota bacterium]
MKLNNESALKVAEFLLQIKAIKLDITNSFTWESGWNAPIYCEIRKILSYPIIRTYIRQEFVRSINDEFGVPDVIAGASTGSIAHAALVAQDMGLPFVYVSKTEKDNGMENIIKGVIESGQSVVIIEDLISTGGTSLKAVDALRNAKCVVKGMTAIFSYGFQVAEDTFKKAKCPVITLSNYEFLIQQAASTGFVEEKDIISLAEWRKNPQNWMK